MACGENFLSGFLSTRPSRATGSDPGLSSRFAAMRWVAPAEIRVFYDLPCVNYEEDFMLTREERLECLPRQMYRPMPRR